MSSIAYLERVKIETFFRLKLPQVVIANYLNQAPTTISYELARCQPYQANLAQADAERKRAHCGRKTKLTGNLKQVIGDHLRLSWSPETIAHEFKLATKSIYSWPNHG